MALSLLTDTKIQDGMITLLHVPCGYQQCIPDLACGLAKPNPITFRSSCSSLMLTLDIFIILAAYRSKTHSKGTCPQELSIKSKKMGLMLSIIMIYLYFKTLEEQCHGDHQVSRLPLELPSTPLKIIFPQFYSVSSFKTLQLELFSPENLLFEHLHLQIYKIRGFPLVTTDHSTDDPIFSVLKAKYHLE